MPVRKATGKEKDLVEHGYKWSPLKFYYRKFVNGPAGKEWRLTFDMMDRAEHASIEEQDVTLFINIRSMDDNIPVYNEMVQEMARLCWAAQDLRTRASQPRSRT